MEKWQLNQKHDTEIKTLLISDGCMVNNQIRRWKHDTWSKINELGHTSLDFNKCSCHKITS